MAEELYDPIQTQIERRRQRAKEEIARLVNRGSHVAFSEFEVTSTSGRAYRVQIRSLTELTNSCTCPDYQTNLVGTCKHIEGVLLHLKDALSDRWDELAAEAPPVTQVYLHHAAQTTVRVSLPLPEQPASHGLLSRYFDAEGILSGRATQTLPALLKEIEALPQDQRASLQVTEQVRRYLDQLQDLESIQRQKEWFLDQLEP